MSLITWLKREPLIVTEVVEKIVEVEVPADPQYDLKKRLELIEAPQEVKDAYLALDADLLTADFNTQGLLCSEFWGVSAPSPVWQPPLATLTIDTPSQVQVSPRSALFVPRSLTPDEQTAVKVAELTDGVTIRPPLKKKIKEFEKGPQRVLFDKQGKFKPVPKAKQK